MKQDGVKEMMMRCSDCRKFAEDLSSVLQLPPLYIPESQKERLKPQSLWNGIISWWVGPCQQNPG